MKQTGLLLVIVLFVLSFYLKKDMIPQTQQQIHAQVHEPSHVPRQPQRQIQMPQEIQVIVAQDYTDTLKNVYAPPVQYRETEFRQIGYITSHGRERLPLFGRVLNRRDKWAYYTLERGIKLPIEFNRRMCTQSPGCDSLSSGDEVLVEGSPYKVQLYESFLTAY